MPYEVMIRKRWCYFISPQEVLVLVVFQDLNHQGKLSTNCKAGRFFPIGRIKVIVGGTLFRHKNGAQAAHHAGSAQPSLSGEHGSPPPQQNEGSVHPKWWQKRQWEMEPSENEVSGTHL